MQTIEGTEYMSEIQPNSLYQAYKAVPLSDDGVQALTALYQPIIGSDALTLYFVLANDASTAEYTHLDLLNQLNFGMQRFLDARYHLEGIGLLTSYQKKSSEFGLLYAYELQEPLSPVRFFADSTYTFLLKNMVGERRFQLLAKRYMIPRYTWSAYTNITKNFTDVYSFQLADYQRDQAKLEQIASHFSKESKPKLAINDQLDWSFLKFHAQKKQISAKNFTDEFSKKLSLYHQYYGLDEMDLVQYMADVVNIATGMVEIDELEKRIVASRRTTRVKESSVNKETEDAEIRRFNTLKLTGFSDLDIQIIKESEQISPADYLAAIKLEKNSYPTKLEEWIVRDLVERSPLPKSVINVLLHYALVVKNNSVLPQKLVDKISADWSEKKVGTPEAAIQLVRTLAKEAQTAKQQRTNQSRYTPNKVTRREQLPKWLVEQEAKKVSNEQVEDSEVALTDEMNERFQAYLKRKEGE